MKRLSIAAGCLAGLLGASLAMAADGPKPKPMNAQELQEFERHIGSLRTELAIMNTCAERAHAIHADPVRPPKDLAEHLHKLYINAAIDARQLEHEKLRTRPEHEEYMRHVNPLLSSLDECGQRYKQGKPFVEGSYKWLAEHAAGDPKAAQRLHELGEETQRAHRHLVEEVEGLSKDSFHQALTMNILKQDFF